MLVYLVSGLVLFILCFIIATLIYFIAARLLGWKRYTCTNCRKKIMYNTHMTSALCPDCQTPVAVLENKSNV